MTVIDLLSKDTYSKLNEVYHDLGSRVLLVYEDIYKQYGLIMRVTDGYRSIEKQNELYEQGRTKPGNIVTRAKGGLSWHNYGLAVDSCFTGKDPYLEAHEKGNEIWEAFGKSCVQNGMIWGGHFLKLHDTPHCEKQYGMSLKQCYDLWQIDGVSGLWAELDKKLQTIHNQENLH